jgi:hypothetical protein
MDGARNGVRKEACAEADREYAAGSPVAQLRRNDVLTHSGGWPQLVSTLRKKTANRASLPPRIDLTSRIQVSTDFVNLTWPLLTVSFGPT